MSSSRVFGPVADCCGSGRLCSPLVHLTMPREMFRKAVTMFWNCGCFVGGGGSDSGLHFHGAGCAISEHHVLTALHCWSEVCCKYQWPVVQRVDGIFQCEAALSYR